MKHSFPSLPPFTYTFADIKDRSKNLRGMFQSEFLFPNFRDEVRIVQLDATNDRTMKGKEKFATVLLEDTRNRTFDNAFNDK